MRKIVVNILWLLFENGSRIVFALLLNALLARAIGIEGFGVIQYVLSLVVIFSAISFICGAEVIVPMLSNLSGKRVSIVIGNVFLLRFIFSCIAYILLIFFVFILEDNNGIVYLSAILGLSILVGESFAVVTAWLQANTNSKPRSILIVLGSFIKCSIVGVLYIYEVKDLRLYALAWIFEAYLIAAGLVFIYKSKTQMGFFSFNKKRMAFFMRKGFPFFLSLLVMYLFLRMDMLILKYYSDFNQVGLYGAAFQLITALSLIAPIFAMSIAPSIVYKSGVQDISKRVIYITLGLALMGIMIATMMNVLSDWLIPFIFGSKFIQAIPIFNYFVWAMVLYFISEGTNIYLIKLGKGRLLTYKWLIVLITGTAAYLYFIPKYHALGAVIGYGLGYFAASIFSFYIILTSKLNIVK